MPRRLTQRCVALLAGVVLLAGCARYTPGEPGAISDELRPGPGLFSGSDGAFTLFDGEDPAAP